MGVAVKVMLVVAVTGPLGLELMDTEAVTLGATLTDTGAAIEVQPDALVTVTP